MATYYFDTSALVKYYHVEPGSAWVKETLEQTNQENLFVNEIFVAELVIVEGTAAFSILTRPKQIRQSARNAMFRRLLADITERFRTIHSTRKHIEAAAALALRHPLKGYDAVQLAIALDLQTILQELEINLIFVSSDNQLVQAAQAEGLQVENPLWHPNSEYENDETNQ